MSITGQINLVCYSFSVQGRENGCKNKEAFYEKNLMLGFDVDVCVCGSVCRC